MGIIDVHGRACPDETHVPNTVVCLEENTHPSRACLPYNGIADRCHRET